MPIQSKLLIELLAAGRLPASRFSAGARLDLRTPLAAGLLEKRRQGAGEVFAVTSPDGFRDWLGARYPGIFGAAAAASPRAGNIALNRDSKRGRQGLDHFPVLARAHAPQAHPDLAALAATTTRWGAAALLLETDPLESRVGGPALPPGIRVMTLENPETFYHSGRLQAEADLFLLAGTGGRMREAFIHWLADQDAIQVVHFGDYDPVGLQEYTRLLARLPGRVTLHLPPGLDDCFRRFSNRALLEAGNNRAVLAGLPRGLNPAMDRVLELIAIHGPLEQEALLIT
jgi:hypothetical protein